MFIGKSHVSSSLPFFLYDIWYDIVSTVSHAQPFNESVVHAMIFNWLCEQYRWKSSYQEGRVCIPLIDLTPLHFWSCPKPGPGFPTSYAVIFLLWSVSSAKTRSDLFYMVHWNNYNRSIESIATTFFNGPDMRLI
jgi:hypothetical protein